MRNRMPELDQGTETQAFIVSLTLPPSPAAGLPKARIRIEHANRRAVWHFTDIDAALAHLRLSLVTLASGSTA